MDSAGLLQDILEHPDDDVPRLIYADWLEDHGGPAEQARAEFIRLQITLAGLPAGDERRPELEAQERRMRKRHERQWLGTLREHVHGWAFSRGFLSHLSLDAAQLLLRHEDLARAHPIQSIRLASARERGVLVRLAALEYLEQIESLDLSNNYLDHNDVGPLLESPHLVSLRALRFNDNPYGYDVALTLAEAGSLGNLTALELRRNNLTDNTALVLAHSPYLTGLRLLDLRGNTIGHHVRQHLQAMFRDGVRF